MRPVLVRSTPAGTADTFVHGRTGAASPSGTSRTGVLALNRLCLISASAVLALGLTACGSGDGASDEPTDPPALGDESSTTAEASPSETPSDDAPGLATDYPDVELTFGALPEVEGAQQQALGAYLAYEHGLRRLSRTAKISPALSEVTGEPLMPTLRNTVSYLRKNDLRYTGPTSIDVAVNGGNARVVVLDLCTDASELRLVQGGKEKPVEGLPRAKGRVTLNSGGTNSWKVTAYSTLEEPC